MARHRSAADRRPAPAVGHSTITFTSLYDGNPNAVSAAERLNQGTFTVYLADPREMCPGGVGPPPPCRGYLHGSFKFYFQRGRPAQPFPVDRPDRPRRPRIAEMKEKRVCVVAARFRALRG